MKYNKIILALFLFSLLDFPKPSPNFQLFGKSGIKNRHSKKSHATAISPTHFKAENYPRVNYTIDAQLFPEEKKVLGSETIEWTNTSTIQANSLRFHLYFNAFKNEKTTFLEKMNFFQSEQQLESFQYGEIKINEIRIVQGEELTSKIQFVSPDDQNPHDKTVMEVKLEQPIAPYQTVFIKINYSLAIPENISGIGQTDDYFFLGQWFPKIGVFQPDGTWNCHQYHWNTEFFSNFGKYKVTLTLPEKYIIGATGNLESKSKNPDGTYSFVFEEENIHDFAWVAYPYFKEIIEKIKLKGNREETKIVLLLSTRHHDLKEHYLNSLKFALQYYADHILPYPYRKITLVDPPFRATDSGNQSYPTLFSISHSILIPDRIKITDSNLFHEFGHQYWYGIIGNDESREPWLDEGINTFFEIDLMEQFYRNSPSFLDSGIFKLDIAQFYRWKYLSIPSSDNINQSSWTFMDQMAYTRNVCYKAAIFLKSLSNYTGHKKMMDFFRFYAHKNRFKHPSTKDFIETFNQFMQDDFSWAFDQFVNNNIELDQSVYSVESVPIRGHAGKYKNEVIFLRHQGYFPSDLLIKLTDGKEMRYLWKERHNWKKINFESDSPIDYAAIDPGFKILLDKNTFNNSRYLKKSSVYLTRISVKLGLVFQDLLTFLFL